MSYSTKAEVREMLKDDALNAIIGDTFIEKPAKREKLVTPIIEGAIADADAEIDGYLLRHGGRFPHAQRGRRHGGRPHRLGP